MKRLFLLVLGILLLVAGNSSADSNIDACFNFMKSGDYQRAIQSGKKAVSTSPNASDSHFCLGRAYGETGDMNGALEEMKKAESLAWQKDDLMYIANWLGLIHDGTGNKEEALKQNERYLALARELGNRQGEATALNNIGGIFKDLGNADKALQYYEESLQLKDDDKAKSPTYNNIAMIYSDRGDYTKAIEYLNNAIEIDNRVGDYHGLAKHKINLGNVYKHKGLFADAEEQLKDGLDKIKKVGDKHWEAVTYKYFGWLYVDMGDRPLARKYLQAAVNLASRIGAKELAEDAQFSLNQLNQPKTYAGIEIGAKGVKANVVVITPHGDDGYDMDEKFRKSINTTIIAGVKEKGVFDDNSIEETAKAVKDLYAQITGKLNIAENDVFIVGSSALWKASNKDVLTAKVRELTGKEINYITKDMEVLFNLAGTMTDKYRSKALSLDIGSGNTKIGYLDNNSSDLRAVAVEIPYGTVSLTDAAMKENTDPEKLASAIDKIIKTDVVPKFNQEMQKKPGLKNRRPVFAVGGIIWAISILTHPENTKGYFHLTTADVDGFIAMLSKNPEAVFNPSLSKIKDDAVKERVMKQIQSIKDTFTQENLLAGSKLLRSLYTELKLKDAIFSRYGSWLWGYVTMQGVYRDMLANAK